MLRIPRGETVGDIYHIFNKGNIRMHPTYNVQTRKKALAKAVRKHYKKYPEALSMQASGAIIPPTVDNHN